ncbi:leukocyte elastase inhibitor-like isoform X2 [Ceratina calcarata]|nr:leukocyte elastase inhibitor-like isoform X2 [Ceratina calcarata]XP_026669398.1 leukocyte elastase inhibitor-like isoform X2 [Ceratina calcarata]
MSRPTPASTSTGKTEDMYKNLSIACNEFTRNIYKQFTAASANENIVSSPLSIHMILSYLSHGADSTTLEEFTKSLYLFDKESIKEGYRSLITQFNELGNIKLYLANAMYVRHDFDLFTEFLTIGKEVYQSEIVKIDFRRNTDAAAKINGWIKKKTNNKIPALVSPNDFDENTCMVLVNAIYFNGNWLQAFDKKNTKDRAFHVTASQQKLVPTMYRKSSYAHGNIPTLKAKFIQIPYMNTDVTMTIILPDDINGLMNVENKYTREALENVTVSNSEVELYLPKFKVEFRIDLRNILRNLDLSLMFEHNANFRRISKVPLLVSKVLHKAVIEVNEEGTEAAAATYAQVRVRRMIVEEPEKFVVDRPFMFIIEYKPSKTSLFIGSIRDIGTSPRKEEL